MPNELLFRIFQSLFHVLFHFVMKSAWSFFSPICHINSAIAGAIDLERHAFAT